MSESKTASPPPPPPSEEEKVSEKVKESASADDSSKKEKEKEGKVILKVSKLTRNVKEDHLKEIFSRYGKIVKVYFGYDKAMGMPTGTSYIKFETHKAAKNAEKYMDEAQIDGARISASLTSSIPEEQCKKMIQIVSMWVFVFLNLIEMKNKTLIAFCLIIVLVFL